MAHKTRTNAGGYQPECFALPSSVSGRSAIHIRSKIPFHNVLDYKNHTCSHKAESFLSAFYLVLIIPQLSIKINSFFRKKFKPALT